MLKKRTFLTALALYFAAQINAWAADKSFVLGTTTSTENSGLLAAILPLFKNDTGIEVEVVAVGTGQALELGRRGDAAALLTHDRVGEDKFVSQGYGIDRRDVMYNDFIIIGPANDPANLNTAHSAKQAFKKIAQKEALFISRGDDSGTHRKEKRLWASISLDPNSNAHWYREVGSSMGQTIVTTTQLNGYTLSDRATWIKFASKADYIIAYEGDPPLNNPYSSILVQNTNLPSENAELAKKWHEWLTSPKGQNAIERFRVDGQQLFFTETKSN